MELTPLQPGACLLHKSQGRADTWGSLHPSSPGPAERLPGKLTSGAAGLRVRCLGRLRALLLSQEVKGRQSKLWPPRFSDQTPCANRWTTCSWGGAQLAPCPTSKPPVPGVWPWFLSPSASTHQEWEATHQLRDYGCSPVATGRRHSSCETGPQEASGCLLPAMVTLQGLLMSIAGLAPSLLQTYQPMSQSPSLGLCDTKLSTGEKIT